MANPRDTENGWSQLTRGAPLAVMVEFQGDIINGLNESLRLARQDCEAGFLGQELIVHLKKFGQVKVFRRIFKNEIPKYYVMYVPDKDTLFLISFVEFKKLHSIHWGIECYHRAIKQVCGIELFMVSQCVGRVPRLEATGEPVRVRTSEAIKTHFFSAIRAFTQLELMRTQELIENWYEVQRNLSLHVARDFILEHLEQKIGLNTHSQISVNA